MGLSGRREFSEDLGVTARGRSPCRRMCSLCQADVFSLVGNVFSFLPNMFSFRPNVFTFPSNVFTWGGQVFSFRRRVSPFGSDDRGAGRFLAALGGRRALHEAPLREMGTRTPG